MAFNPDPYVKGCADCRLCKGAAFQSPPFLFAGSAKPTVLIVMQNPGQIGSEDKWRFDMMSYALSVHDSRALTTVYDIDFFTSKANKALENIFGENWLLSGAFMYTNAVRCRTPENKMPSDEMIANCTGWTAQLPITPIVVLMGRVAVKQFCDMVKKPELGPWQTVSLKRGKITSKVITLPHYVAIKTSDDFEKAKSMFDEVFEGLAEL